MKGSEIRVGMTVQVAHGYGSKSRDHGQHIEVGVVVDTDLVEMQRYSSSKVTLRDGSEVVGHRRNPGGGGNARHAVRVLRTISEFQPDEVWQEAKPSQGRQGTLVMVPSAGVIREWTPEVEEQVLAQRKARREAEQARKAGLLAQAERSAMQQNGALDEMAGLDLPLPDAWRRAVLVEPDYRLSSNARQTMYPTDVLALVRAAYAAGQADAAVSA